MLSLISEPTLHSRKIRQNRVKGVIPRCFRLTFSCLRPENPSQLSAVMRKLIEQRLLLQSFPVSAPRQPVFPQEKLLYFPLP